MTKLDTQEILGHRGTNPNYNFGAPTLSRNPEEILQCETIYNETACRSETKRFTVNLPFCSSPPKLGNSYYISLQCLRSLQRRLNANPILKEKCSAIM